MSLELFSALNRQLPEVERQTVKFAVGGLMCAVDIMHVREIILPRVNITPMSGNIPSIIGVLDHRDAAIPVIDLRNRFSVKAPPATKQKWVIIAVDEKSIALVVDEVFGVTRFQQNQMRDRSALGTTDVDWAANVYGEPDGLVFEIDLDILAGDVISK